jgi:hypothetical protein
MRRPSGQGARLPQAGGGSHPLTNQGEEWFAAEHYSAQNLSHGGKPRAAEWLVFCGLTAAPWLRDNERGFGPGTTTKPRHEIGAPSCLYSITFTHR